MLATLHRRLCDVMGRLNASAELILVDDGSADGSFDVMRKLREADDRVRALRLPRNFGHQVAITAGLDHARGLRQSEGRSHTDTPNTFAWRPGRSS
jgi:dolichol-phosphate mannosyltransferase